jgi:hypothetical protein
MGIALIATLPNSQMNCLITSKKIGFMTQRYPD